MDIELLKKPSISYITGFIQTDGTHSGDPTKKGRITIELACRDEAHLEAIGAALPWKTSLRRRTRQTNFSNGDYTTVILNLFAQDARQFFAAAGVAPGRKSAAVGPPDAAHSARDFVRGVIDGDGSVGFTANGYPFISVVTASERLAVYLCDVIAEVCLVRRNSRRNTRDHVYNIMVTSNAARALASWCYYDDALALPRKAAAASEIMAWEAPTSRYGVSRRSWTPGEDAVLRSHSATDATQLLDRTERSVKMRRWRLGSQVRQDLAPNQPDRQAPGTSPDMPEPGSKCEIRNRRDEALLMPDHRPNRVSSACASLGVRAPLAQLVRAGDS